MSFSTGKSIGIISTSNTGVVEDVSQDYDSEILLDESEHTKNQLTNHTKYKLPTLKNSLLYEDIFIPVFF